MNREDFKKKYSTETFLGDGLYASFDGFQINLRAPRENIDHHVSLEPSVFENLLMFRESIYKDIEKLSE